MVIFWLIALIVFAIIEGVTFGLTSIWFAAGSLAALISAAVGAQIWLQIALFVIVSAVTLYFTRPFIKKYIVPKVTSTNADRAIDKIGVVTETIDNIAGTGAVSVEKKLWTARSENGEVITAGENVRIIRISGVKLFVEKAQGIDKSDKSEEESRLVDARR